MVRSPLLMCDLYTYVSPTAVSCKLSSTPFISPTFGNMLGGTAITITIASRCSEEISGTPLCIFDGNRMVPAVDDSGLPTSGQNYFCTLPLFERTGRITFEFRAQLKTTGMLSLFDNFNICENPSRLTTCTTLPHYQDACLTLKSHSVGNIYYVSPNPM